MITPHFLRAKNNNSLATSYICKANSLVGTNIKALIEFVFFLSVFINCNIGITKEPVLPVPFFALAIMFFLNKASGITSSCTGDGAS